jgi:hypothetical protein
MAEENKSLLQKIREVPFIAEVREKLKNDILKQIDFFRYLIKILPLLKNILIQLLKATL